MLIFRDSAGKILTENNKVAFCVEVRRLESAEYTFKNSPYEVELFKDFYVNPDMLSNLKTTNKTIEQRNFIEAKDKNYD